jgi:hypothetical protein
MISKREGDPCTGEKRHAYRGLLGNCKEKEHLHKLDIDYNFLRQRHSFIHSFI